MTSDQAKFDAHMMGIALSMARRGLGLTAPNPSVGAVIANEATGELIARAVTAKGGRPHGEPQAIQSAGERARGQTLYVTLEPCSHFGKTPPCADAIIAAGLARVVVGIEDPDPRVAGRGLDRLRAAGIAVTRGVRAEEARWLTRGHVVRVTERRPLVTLKLALDAQGRVPHGDGRNPTFVTSPQARAHGHLLRAVSDAILVGAGTMRADDPQLTCRLAGLAARTPLRVVLSKSLEIAEDARLLRDVADHPVLAVAAFGVDEQRKEALEARGVEVAEVVSVAGHLWLPAVMEALVARGVTRLLVEGGPSLWRAFAQKALADEVVVYVAGAADKMADAPALLDQVSHYLGPIDLTITDTRRLGPDRLWHLRAAHQAKGI